MAPQPASIGLDGSALVAEDIDAWNLIGAASTSSLGRFGWSPPGGLSARIRFAMWRLRMKPDFKHLAQPGWPGASKPLPRAWQRRHEIV